MPVRVGGIVHDRLANSWLTDMKVFHPPDGRVYAAVTGDDFLILDVTDPAKPVIIDGALEGAGSSHLTFGDVWQATVYERPDGRGAWLQQLQHHQNHNPHLREPQHLSGLCLRRPQSHPAGWSSVYV